MVLLSWSTLSHGPPSLMVHPHSRSTLSHGPPIYSQVYLYSDTLDDEDGSGTGGGNPSTGDYTQSHVSQETPLLTHFNIPSDVR